MASYWNMNKLLGLHPFKKIWFFSITFNSHGLMFLFLIYTTILIVLILWRSCASNHSCYEFKGTMALSHLKDIVYLSSCFLVLIAFLFSHPQCPPCFEGGCGCDIHALLMCSMPQSLTLYAFSQFWVSVSTSTLCKIKLLW